MRYELIDNIRGLNLISMILYHLTWDLVNLYGFPWNWFYSNGAYFWQQTICWIFILLSGFCWPMGKHPIKRGLTVIGSSVLVSVITIFFVPEGKIIFGVLTLLGVSMLLMIPLEQLTKKIPPVLGMIVSFGIFFLFRNTDRGWMGFEHIQIYPFPKGMYQNMITTFLGFPQEGFYSADYFPVLPWFFLFLTGYFLYRILQKNNLLYALAGKRTLSKKTHETAERSKDRKGIFPITVMGRRSLLIYLLHQPVIYIFLMLLFSSAAR